MIKVLSLGELLWDVFPDNKVWGGAPVNFAFHASQFGADASAVTAVGNDDAGREIVDKVRSLGINLQCAVVDKPTGQVIIEINADGEPGYTFNSDCAWDYIPFNDEVSRLCSEADLIAFGTLALRSEVSRNTIFKCLDSRKNSAKVLFDVNLRQDFYSREIIEASLRQADFLKVNKQEARVLEDCFGKSLVQIHDDFGLEVTMLTKGGQGSKVIGQYGEFDSPATAGKVVDTVGAGDAFTAAFITDYLNGTDIMFAQMKASNAAAYVCSKQGATVEIPQHLK